jgi:hypothetical protein
MALTTVPDALQFKTSLSYRDLARAWNFGSNGASGSTLTTQISTLSTSCSLIHGCYFPGKLVGEKAERTGWAKVVQLELHCKYAPGLMTSFSKIVVIAP